MFDQQQMQQPKINLGMERPEMAAAGQIRPAGRLQQIQMLLAELLSREEVMINRLENFHEHLFGPTPVDSSNREMPPPPSGALNELGMAMEEALERFARISRILCDLETLV